MRAPPPPSPRGTLPVQDASYGRVPTACALACVGLQSGFSQNKLAAQTLTTAHLTGLSRHTQHSTARQGSTQHAAVEELWRCATRQRTACERTKVGSSPAQPTAGMQLGWGVPPPAPHASPPPPATRIAAVAPAPAIDTPASAPLLLPLTAGAAPPLHSLPACAGAAPAARRRSASSRSEPGRPLRGGSSLPPAVPAPRRRSAGGGERPPPLPLPLPHAACPSLSPLLLLSLLLLLLSSLLLLAATAGRR